jgi:lysophospholipase L1-like esterase
MKNYNNEAVQYQNQAGKSASPQEASIAFMNIFENPATSVSHDERREKAAKKAMDRFGNGGGTALATGSDETEPSGEGGTCCGSTPVGTDSDSTLSDVYVLGDSITEASESAYKKAFNDQSIKFDIDASVSRGIDAPGTTGNKLSGSQAISRDKDKIKKADAVVVALGTNGGATGAQINKTVTAIENINPDASIYWVDIISVGRSDNFNDTITGPTNRAIRKEAADNGYQVIHWFNKVDPDGNPGNPSKSEKDPNGYISKEDNLGVHPTAAGSKALAGLVLKSIGGAPSAATGPDDSGAGECCGTPGGGSITLSGNDNEQQVFNFFTGNMGYSPDQAAGAVGSLMLESSMNPTISNGSGSGAYGIAQWLGSRFTGLKTFAGKDYDTLQGQVGFMQHELKTGYASVNSKMKKASSYQEAQKIWTQYYEGLLDYPDQWYFAKRNNFAHDALQKYGGGGGGSGGGGSCEGGSASANVNTAVQAAKELSSYKIPYVWGGLHGANQLAITDPKKLKDIGADCSGSVSWVLHQAGMLGASADDSTALESWGQAGKGQTMTVWANSEHAFIEFNVPGLGHYQLNTSGWSGSGPHFFKMDYNTDGFTPRHWPGT